LHFIATQHGALTNATSASFSETLLPLTHQTKYGCKERFSLT